MKFKLEIDMGNAAFEDYPDELPKLLELMALLARGNKWIKGDSGPLFDTNGNKVGAWEVTE